MFGIFDTNQENEVGRSLQENGGTTGLIDLLPFEVIIAFLDESTVVTEFALTDVVDSWMTQGFETVLEDANVTGLYSRIDQVIVDYQEPNSNRNLKEVGQDTSTIDRTSFIQDAFDNDIRDLQESSSITIAKYTGASIWQHFPDKIVPTTAITHEIQLRVMITQNDLLLQGLQAAGDPLSGLGSNVFSVRTRETIRNNNNNNNNNGMKAIIIIAIVIATLAFFLLVTALLMAWKSKQTKDAAYAVGAPKTAPGKKSPSSKGQVSLYDETPKRKGGNMEAAPSIDGGLYADSLISEDISTSLTAYYRSGMGGKESGGKGGKKAIRTNSGGMNDNASISSMESYGYSLDGYQSSVAPSTMEFKADPYEKDALSVSDSESDLAEFDANFSPNFAM